MIKIDGGGLNPKDVIAALEKEARAKLKAAKLSHVTCKIIKKGGEHVFNFSGGTEDELKRAAKACGAK